MATTAPGSGYRNILCSYNRQENLRHSNSITGCSSKLVQVIQVFTKALWNDRLVSHLLSLYTVPTSIKWVSQAGSKIAGRNINNFRYADDTTLMAENKEELKNLLMKVKGKSEKVGLKHNIQKTKVMAFGPITSWQVGAETVSDFILGGCKITADGGCSHEIKRRLLLGRKAMKNLDSILKSRDITLPTKICLVKVMVFPVVTYGCESWTIKKAEYQRIDAFELWCWRRLLRVPWTANQTSQS